MRQIKGYTLAVGMLWATSILTGIVRSQEPRIPLETRNFMRAKLLHSQKILEGLATENYDLVTKHAQEMSLLSLESQWNVLRTQEYVEQSADFRHAIAKLIEAADAKKIDATTLGYVDVTLKCIHCHKYVRDKGAKEAIGLVRPSAEGAQESSVTNLAPSRQVEGN
jgi:hypothetical protein